MIDYIIIASIFVIGFIVTFYIFRELKVNTLNDKIHELEIEMLNNHTEIMKLQNEIELLETTIEAMRKPKN
jgi:peptidoglycan hydrolase CwlO-like protein